MLEQSGLGQNFNAGSRKLLCCWITAAAIFLLVASSACSTPGGRTAGMVYDDALISTKIKTRLTEMMGAQVIGVDVDVYLGEVTLQGRVQSPNLESRVIAVTAQTQGVRKVINLLKIIP